MIKSNKGKIEIAGNFLEINLDLLCLLAGFENEFFELLKKCAIKDKPEINVFLNLMQQASVQAKIICENIKEN